MSRKDQCLMLSGNLTLSRKKRTDKGDTADRGLSKNSLIRDQHQLESVLGQSQLDWFERLTEQRLEHRPSSTLQPSGLLDSPSATPTLSQLINVSGLRVGSSPGFSYNSPVRFGSSHRQSPIHSPESWSNWQKPLLELGLSPSPRQPVSTSKLLSHPSSATVQSLGLVPEDTAFSWTNSLATPPRDLSDLWADLSTAEGKQKELARALFSPSNRLNTTGDSIQPLDSTYEDDQSTGHQSDQSMEDVTESVSNHGDHPTVLSEQEEVIGPTGARCIVHNVSRFAEISCESDNVRVDTGEMKYGTMEPAEENSTDYIDKENSEKLQLSPTFTQKCSRKCFKGKKSDIKKRRTRLQEVSMDEILSDFFDSPASATRKRKQPASYASGLTSPYSEHDDCDKTLQEACHSSPVLSKVLPSDVRCSTPKERTGSLHSILSSSLKKKGSSSSKKVRFSESVRKYSIGPNYHSLLKSKKAKKAIHNVGSDAKKVKFEEVILTYKEAEVDIDSDIDSRGKCEGNSDEREGNNVDETGDSIKNDFTVQRRNEQGTLQESNVKHESCPYSSKAKLIVCDKLNRDTDIISIEDDIKKVEAAGDEFSQISPTALNEMCSVAEQPGSCTTDDTGTKGNSVNIDTSANEKVTVRGSLQKPTEVITPMTTVINRKQAPMKFMYPSTSHIVTSFPKKVFKYEENSQTVDQEGLVRPVLTSNIVVAREKTPDTAELTSLTLDNKNQLGEENILKCFNKGVKEDLVDLKGNFDLMKGPSDDIVEMTKEHDREIYKDDTDGTDELEQEMTYDNSSESGLKQDDLMKSRMSNPVQGFQSASGKLLKLTAESLEKASRLLNDENSIVTLSNRKENSSQLSMQGVDETVETNVTDFSGEWTEDFDCAVPESEFNSSPSKNEHEDKTMKEGTHLELKKSSINNRDSSHYSKIEKQDSCPLLANDGNVKPAIQTQTEAADIQHSKVQQSGFSGFKTASGKKLELCEEAFRKAETCLGKENDVAVDFNRSSKGIKISVGGNKSKSTDQLKVSEQLQQPSNKVKLLGDFEKTCSGSSRLDNSNVGMSTNIGFSTAGGKHLKLSHTNIKKARSLLGEFMEGMEEQIAKETETDVSKQKLFKERTLSVADRLKLDFQMDSLNEVYDIESIAEEMKKLKSKRSEEGEKETFNNGISQAIIKSSKPATKTLSTSKSSNLPQGYRPFKPHILGGNKGSGKKTRYPESKISDWNCTETKQTVDEKVDDVQVKQNVETLTDRNPEMSKTAEEKTFHQENMTEENKNPTTEPIKVLETDTPDFNCNDMYQGLSQVFSEELDASFEDTHVIKAEKATHAAKPLKAKPVPQFNMGFTTASGKSFYLSETAVLSAQKLLADTEDNLMNDHESCEQESSSIVSENVGSASNHNKTDQSLSNHIIAEISEMSVMPEILQDKIQNRKASVTFNIDNSKVKSKDLSGIHEESECYKICGLSKSYGQVPLICSKSSLNASIGSMDNDSVGRHEYMDDRAENDILSSIDLSKSVNSSSKSTLIEATTHIQIKAIAGQTDRDARCKPVITSSNERKSNVASTGLSSAGVDSKDQSKIVFDSGKEHIGFQIASDKQVNISKDAVVKAQNLLSLERDLRSQTHEVHNQRQETPTYAKTCVNKQSVEMNNEIKNIEETCKSPDSGWQTDKTNRTGTQTPAGKCVNAAEEALLSTNICIETDGSGSHVDAHFKEGRPTECSLEKGNACEGMQLPLRGFKTASSKDVQISDEAIEKAKQAFSNDANEISRNCDDDDENEYRTNVIHDKSGLDFKMATINPKEFKEEPSNLFKTASGKAVKSSDHSILVAKRKLDIDSTDSNIEAVHINASDHDQHISKKKKAPEQQLDLKQITVGVNNELFCHTNLKGNLKQLSSATEPQDELRETNETKLGFCANSDKHLEAYNIDMLKPLSEGACFFQTASGKKVNVSDQSLNIAKNKLVNEDETNSLSLDFPISDADDYEVSNSKETEIDTSDANVKLNDINEATSAKIVPCAENSLEEKPNDAYFAETLCGSKNSCQTLSAGGERVSDKYLESEINKDILVNKKQCTRTNAFQTASGRQINVSEKALAFARETLEETNTVGAESTLGSLFQTASGGQVKVSEKAIALGRKTFEDTHIMGEESSNGNPFQTASGGQVRVSEKALTFARKTLDDTHIVGKESTKGNPFQTASGGQVKVSEKALAFARKTLDDTNTMRIDPTCGNPFKTASGEEVKVSDKALEYARETLLNTVDISKESSCTNPFQTASGGQVKVSEKALEFARRSLVDACDDDNGSSYANPFSSASGGEVKVSEKALSFARKSLEEMYNPTSEKANLSENAAAVSGPGNISQELRPSNPFQTASGGTVKISDKALAFARKTLSDTHAEIKLTVENTSLQSLSCSMHEAEGSKNIQVTRKKTLVELECEKQMNPFQTASGSAVATSETALAFARNTFNETEKGFDSASSFQSASGKEMKVSEKAIALARRKADKSVSGKVGNDTDEVSVKDRSSVVLETNVCGKVCNRNVEDVTPGNNDSVKDGEEVCSFREELLNLRSERDKIMRNRSSQVTEEDLGKSADVDGCPPVKRQKLDDGMEKTFDAVFDKGSLKRKPVTTRPEGITTDRRPKGFRPFIPVRSMMLQQPAQMLDSILESRDVSGPKKDSAGIKPAFHTPYRSAGNVVPSPAVTPSKVKVTAPIFRNSLAKVESTEVVLDTSSGMIGYEHTKEPSWKTCSKKKSSYGNGMGVVRSDSGNKEELTRSKECIINEAGVSDVSDELDPEGLIHLKHRQHQLHVGNAAGQTFGDDRVQVSAKDATDGMVNEAGKTCGENGAKVGVRDVGNRMEVEELDSSMASYSQDEEDVYYCTLVEARRQQGEIIQDKGRVKPMAGRLYEMKQSPGRLSLRDLVTRRGDAQPGSCPRPAVCSATAGDYRFHLADHYTRYTAHVLVGDGAFLVPDDSGHAGKHEFYRSFLTLSGVDPKLISEAWLNNHYRWIVWKLAAYEVTVPGLAGRCLTPEMVMLQLKYRYDREIDLAQRSAIRKIFEKDDTASKRMVLCVAGILHVSAGANADHAGSCKTNPDSKVVLELTDGWYSIRATTDVPLTDLVHRGKLWVGQKLCITGTETVGGDNACSPLEAPESVTLKLCCNSARPCPWDSPLGYQCDPRPLCFPLCCLYGEGGTVGVVDVVVVRKYPTMYMEKLPGGSSVFRTGRCEEKASQEFESQREVAMQRVYSEVEAEMDKENRQGEKPTVRGTRKWGRSEVDGLGTGQEIYEGLNSAQQPDSFQNNLSERQLEMLYEYQRQVQEEKQLALNARFQAAWQDRLETAPDRNVTPVLKFRVSGCSRKDIDSGTSTILTIWRPCSEISELQEGKRYKIYSLNASMSRSKYTGHTVQLTATKHTKFQQMSLDENFLDNVYETREVLWVSDVIRGKPAYGELDFVGVVVKSVSASAVASGKPCDTVYLADCQENILAIKIWNGFKCFGEDLFVVGSLLCCSNLMDKSSYRSHLLPGVEAASEFTCFTKKPQNSGQRKAWDRLNSAIQDNKGFLERAQTTLENHLSGKPAYSESFKTTPSRISGNEFSSSSIPLATTTSPDTPADLDNTVSTPCKTPEKSPVPPYQTNLESGPSHGTDTPTMTTPHSGQARSRKSVLQNKMARLSTYSSPGLLSPMNTPVTKGVRKAFKPPTFKNN